MGPNEARGIEMDRARLDDAEGSPPGHEITLEIPEAILHEALRRYLGEGLLSVPVVVKAVEFQPPGVTYWSQVSGARVTVTIRLA